MRAASCMHASISTRCALHAHVVRRHPPTRARTQPGQQCLHAQHRACGPWLRLTPPPPPPSPMGRSALRKLHMDTCAELGVEEEVRDEISRLINELQQLLIGISIMQDLTPRAKDSLVSFGERMATRIFASYLRVNVSGGGARAAAPQRRPAQVHAGRHAWRGVPWAAAACGRGQAAHEAGMARGSAAKHAAGR